MSQTMLEREQAQLLFDLVEARQSLSKGEREPFRILRTGNRGDFVLHPGLPHDYSVYVHDLEVLARAGSHIKSIRCYKRV